MFDHHLHVWTHGPGTPQPSYDQLARYCEAAAAVGVEQIAITEHSHRFDRVLREVSPHWRRPLTGEAAEATAHVLAVEGGGDLDRYVATLVDAQERGLPLLVGLEVDWWPGADRAMAAVLDDYPFDVLLGSVHWIDEWLFDAYDTPAFARRWQGAEVDAVFDRYVDEVLALASSGLVDVLAHLDVIRVAGHRASELAEHDHRLATGLAGSGLVIEVSSGGLRKPVADIYPAPDLLRKLVDAGMTFTTASDGHDLDQVGRGLDRVREELRGVGVDVLTTFDRRRPQSVPI